MPTKKTEPTAVTEKLAKLTEQAEEFKAKMRREGEEVMKESFAAFFAAYPNVKAVAWTQYAPYFNDGEPCTFSVNDPSLIMRTKGDEAKLTGEQCDNPDEEIDIEDVDCDTGVERYSIKKTAKNKALVSDFEVLGAAICADSLEDMMAAVFNDDCQVVATADGFDVREYSHD